MENNSFFYNKIRTVNGIMCVWVVFLHSYNIERYSSLSWKITPLAEGFFSKSVGEIAVPTFFLMSAILFFQNFDLSKTWTKYKSRMLGVVIPYILWNAIYLVVFLALVNFPLSRQFMDTKEIPINLETIIDSVIFYKYNGVYWFMYQLILFDFISPVIYLIMKPRYSILVIPALFIISYWFPNIPVCSKGIRVDCLVYWVLGAYFALHRKEQTYHRCSSTKIYLVLSLLLIMLRFYIEFINRAMNMYKVSDILLFLNVLSVWFALDMFKFHAVKGWMGLSFFIYTLHPLIVWSIKNVVSVLLPGNDVMVLINYIIAGIGGVVIPVYVAKVMNRCMPKLFGILCGQRTMSGQIKKV